MSTTIYPPISPTSLLSKESESLSKELTWLLTSLTQTLQTLKQTLLETSALLSPSSTSTLPISTPRSETIKGVLTRAGTTLTSGKLSLRLKTSSIGILTLGSAGTDLEGDGGRDEAGAGNGGRGIVVRELKRLRGLLDDALDCIDVTLWTGNASNAEFMSGQLLLLHRILVSAKLTLCGNPPPPPPPSSSAPPTSPTQQAASSATWPEEMIDASHFTATAGGGGGEGEVVVNFEIQEASLVVCVRVLEDTAREVGFGTKFALAIGAQRRLEHDEMDEVFTIPAQSSGGSGTAAGKEKGKGRERRVRVKEKVRVESADPSLMSAMAKIGALEHSVGMVRCCLATVMEKEVDEV